MTNFAKVKDHKGLVRDMESKAILNTDSQALIEHRKKRQAMVEVFNNTKKIESLEQDVSEIKNMLRQLLEKK